MPNMQDRDACHQPGASARQDRHPTCKVSFARASPRCAAILSIAFVLAGCRSPLQPSVLALDAATAPVIDQAAATYRAANALHNLSQDYDAVARFDTAQPAYNPRTIEVLLSDKDIDTRLAVLEGFQVYVKSLCAITSGTDPQQLATASASAGGKLSRVADTLLPTVEKAVGITPQPGQPIETTVTTSSTSGGTITSTSTTSTGSAPPIGSDAQRGISTAVYALGRFLVSRKVKSELPAKIAEMDPHVNALATLLENDIDVLRDQEHRDYDRIVNLQTVYIRENASLGPEQRRAEIVKLPEFVRQARTTDERLTSLRAAIVLLAQAHHELMENAQSTSPETFNQKLQDLANAAAGLGTFYSSLP